MLKNGSSKEEIVTWIEENKLRVNHWFTVDDLNHLKRWKSIWYCSSSWNLSRN